MHYYTTIILFILIIVFLVLLIDFEQLQIDIMTHLVINRGVIHVNCIWYRITELFFKDGSGINIYNRIKSRYGDFKKALVFGKECYLVTNIDHIKIILDNSPDIFNVGELKFTFFTPLNI